MYFYHTSPGNVGLWVISYLKVKISFC